MNIGTIILDPFTLGIIISGLNIAIGTISTDVSCKLKYSTAALKVIPLHPKSNDLILASDY